MNWLVVHIASGQSFFSGLGLLILAVLVTCTSRNRLQRFAPLLAVVGLIAVALSSTAIPYWAYAILTAAVSGWWATRGSSQRRRFTGAAAALAACLLCAALELPFHVKRTPTRVSKRSLVVIGDSVTAGLGVETGEITWPPIFAREHGVHVDDLSHVGETAASALKRARQHQIEAPIVLIEIGGNDVLGSTTAAQFEHDLDALLAHLAAPGRQLLMFELPLPPHYHEFGRAQRAAARRHGVELIPRRVLLGVLAADGMTLDSIHLSQAGHQRMADVVWELIGPAYSRIGSGELTASVARK